MQYFHIAKFRLPIKFISGRKIPFPGPRPVAYKAKAKSNSGTSRPQRLVYFSSRAKRRTPDDPVAGPRPTVKRRTGRRTSDPAVRLCPGPMRQGDGRACRRHHSCCRCLFLTSPLSQGPGNFFSLLTSLSLSDSTQLSRSHPFHALFFFLERGGMLLARESELDALEI